MNETQKNHFAPGRPGFPASWTSSAKTGVVAAYLVDYALSGSRGWR